MIDSLILPMYAGEDGVSAFRWNSRRPYVGIGLDPSLRHGSCVRVLATCLSGKIDIHFIDIVGQWGKQNTKDKRAQGIGIKEEMWAYNSFGISIANMISNALQSTVDGCRVFVDWVPGGSLSNVRMAALLAYVMGVISSNVIDSHCEYIHPSTLRASMGMQPKDEKAMVHWVFKHRKIIEKPDLMNVLENLSEDAMDALILSLYPLLTKE